MSSTSGLLPLPLHWPLPLPLPAVGYSGPAKTLARKPPPCTLVGPLVISQLLVHIALITAFQLATWFYLHSTLWSATMEMPC